MPRYAAFLRGVSPLNAKMPELKRAFEAAGFGEVRTLLSSGNVVFSTSRAALEATLARKAEQAMQATLGRSFGTLVRSTAHLQALVRVDPFAPFAPAADSKCVITFLREPPSGLQLPIEREGVRILQVVGLEAFTDYRPNPKGPVFMTMLERTFGSEVTTRTFDTVKKCAVA